MVEDMLPTDKCCPLNHFEKCLGSKCMAFESESRDFQHKRWVYGCKALERLRVGELKW